MPDTAEASTETQSAQTNSDAVNPAGKDSKNAPQLLHIPKPPSEFDDMHRSSRARRVAAMAAQMDEEGDAEVRAKILGKDKKPAEAETATGDEPETKAKSADEVAADKADLEKKSEERRLALKAKADKAMRGAVEDDETGNAPAEAETPTEKVVDALEAAAEDIAKVEGPKPEPADKERKAKFEKVLKMEAEARKRDEKLRAREDGMRRIEADLNAKAKTLEENYKRLVARNERDVQMASRVLQLARENPLELLERSGAKPEDVAKWIEDASDPVQQKLRAYDQRFADMERREAELKQREAAAQQEAQRSQTRQNIEKQYLGHFDEQEGEDYLFEAARYIYSPTERVRLGDEIAQAAHQRGMTFTSRDIAEAVDAEAREDERWKALQKRLTKAVAEKPAEAAKPAAAAPAAKPAVASRPTVVATNAAAQDSAPAKGGTGSGGRKMSPKEQRDLRNKRLFAGLDE
jgi:hypothetical protein